MSRLNQVKYNEKEETIEVGAGCLFCEVYDYILPLGRNIVGGASISGVGVAGWLLGGGYSLKTNQYGLGIDNIKEIQIVLPMGGKDAIKTVTDKSRYMLGDLFWAIKVSFGLPTPVTFLVSFAIYASGRRKQLWDSHQIYSQDAPAGCNLRQSTLTSHVQVLSSASFCSGRRAFVWQGTNRASQSRPSRFSAE
jgi:hypothetical protein